MTIRIAGATVPLLEAQMMFTLDRIPPELRRGRPHYYLDFVFLLWAVSKISAGNASFASEFEFQAAVVAESVAVHEALEVQKQAWKGRTPGHFIRFQDIPLAYRAAIRNLISNNRPAPGHDRGRHQSSPIMGNAGRATTREYDLTLSREGRLTVRTLNGRRGYYYSRHHTEGMYEYLLITDSVGRPIFGGTPSADLICVPTPDS